MGRILRTSCEECKVTVKVNIWKCNVPRGQWQKACVLETHKERDSLIRSVTLHLSSGRHTRRPVQRLHLLETCDADVAAGLK